MRVCVIVPTYNGGAIWHECAVALEQAQLASRYKVSVQVVDSTSSDDTVDVARQHGFAVAVVPSSTFDHGGTRNQAAMACPTDADIVVFITQDAILNEPDALDALIHAFEDPTVVVAYGRQLPHTDANPIATHARLFNYGTQSHVVGLQDKAKYGIKTVFTSNSFAAYRLSVFRALGGFPEQTILSEDMYFAARAVLAGHKIAYVAQAQARHSHNYTPWQEFRRYFDIGVFHHDEAWIGQEFGGAGGEGSRFLKSELQYLLKYAPLWVLRASLHNVLKIVGYKLGKQHGVLPVQIKPFMSMHREHWR
ncbi:glycosyltransferase [Pusillimonas sp. TS35]|nr:glycosyltransferase [Pusillimonas sp. TS35]